MEIKAVLDKEGNLIQGSLNITKEFFENYIKNRECESVEIDGKEYQILKVRDYYLIDEFECVKKLKENAIRDGLTGCYNKVEILEFLEKFLHSYLRYKNNYFSVLMFDIDHFKKINDTYGHLAGDYVLKELANLVKNMMRKSDVCGRFGGEEFIIILPETKIAGAMKFAQRLKNNVESHRFVFNNTEIKVTISIGITGVGLTDTIDSLLARVDEALYEAKRKGRNRVEYR